MADIKGSRSQSAVLATIGLRILLIYSVICFVKASLMLNMKVVPNDILIKFSDERDNLRPVLCCTVHWNRFRCTKISILIA